MSMRSKQNPSGGIIRNAVGPLFLPATVAEDSVAEAAGLESTAGDGSADELPSQPFHMVIAALTEQLKRENETIARLMQRQRQLRQQLLQAQEQSLAALRKNEIQTASKRNR